MNTKGFTLIELVVIIAIIGILAYAAMNFDFSKKTAKENVGRFANLIHGYIRGETLNSVSGRGVLVGATIQNYDRAEMTTSTQSLLTRYYNTGTTVIGTGKSLISPFYGDDTYKIAQINVRSKSGVTSTGGTVVIVFSQGGAKPTLTGTLDDGSQIPVDTPQIEFLLQYNSYTGKVIFDTRTMMSQSFK